VDSQWGRGGTPAPLGRFPPGTGEKKTGPSIARASGADVHQRVYPPRARVQARRVPMPHRPLCRGELCGPESYFNAWVGGGGGPFQDGGPKSLGFGDVLSPGLAIGPETRGVPVEFSRAGPVQRDIVFPNGRRSRLSKAGWPAFPGYTVRRTNGSELSVEAVGRRGGTGGGASARPREISRSVSWRAAAAFSFGPIPKGGQLCGPAILRPGPAVWASSAVKPLVLQGRRPSPCSDGRQFLSVALESAQVHAGLLMGGDGNTTAARLWARKTRGPNGFLLAGFHPTPLGGRKAKNLLWPTPLRR